MPNPQFFNDAEIIKPPTDQLNDDPLPSEAAYQIVMDEAMLDGNARLNHCDICHDMDGRERQQNYGGFR